MSDEVKTCDELLGEIAIYKAALKACGVYASSVLTDHMVGTPKLADETFARLLAIENEVRNCNDPDFVGRVVRQEWEVEHLRNRITTLNATIEQLEADKRLVGDHCRNTDTLFRQLVGMTMRNQPLPDWVKARVPNIVAALDLLHVAGQMTEDNEVRCELLTAYVRECAEDMQNRVSPGAKARAIDVLETLGMSVRDEVIDSTRATSPAVNRV